MLHNCGTSTLFDHWLIIENASILPFRWFEFLKELVEATSTCSVPYFNQAQEPGPFNAAVAHYLKVDRLEPSSGRFLT